VDLKLNFLKEATLHKRVTYLEEKNRSNKKTKSYDEILRRVVLKAHSCAVKEVERAVVAVEGIGSGRSYSSGLSFRSRLPDWKRTLLVTALDELYDVEDPYGLQVNEFIF